MKQNDLQVTQVFQVLEHLPSSNYQICHFTDALRDSFIWIYTASVISVCVLRENIGFLSIFYIYWIDRFE